MGETCSAGNSGRSSKRGCDRNRQIAAIEPISPAQKGNYNTQQHWVTHRDALYLVYTRRGADNDHVFRHRAPLWIAQVDPWRLNRAPRTERVLVPEHGARLGNFGVTEVSDREAWVTAAEWMQPEGVEKHGSDNRIFVAKIRW